MTLKNVLLGAAAMLAFSTAAKAADAIVAADAEPQEYVRVCDAFGTGYFYIPGTETCLQVGGYVRFDLRGGELLGRDTNADGEGDAWGTRTRFALRLSTAADTEIGTLKTYVETRFNHVNGVSQTPSLYAGYIDVAGFRVGKDESTFVTFSGKAGAVVNDDLIPYGTYEAQLLSYTFDAGNGFSAIVALEDDGGDGDGYVPNAVIGAKYKGDVFGASLTGAYDEGAEAGVIKARADGKFGAVSVFLMGAYNTGDVSNYYANWRGDWALWGGSSIKLSDSATLNAQLSLTERDDFAAAAGVAIKLASGFVITPELAYFDRADSYQRWGGTLRFQRSF